MRTSMFDYPLNAALVLDRAAYIDEREMVEIIQRISRLMTAISILEV